MPISGKTLERFYSDFTSTIIGATFIVAILYFEVLPVGFLRELSSFERVFLFFALSFVFGNVGTSFGAEVQEKLAKLINYIRKVKFEDQDQNIIRSAVLKNKELYSYRDDIVWSFTFWHGVGGLALVLFVIALFDCQMPWLYVLCVFLFTLSQVRYLRLQEEETELYQDCKKLLDQDIS